MFLAPEPVNSIYSRVAEDIVSELKNACFHFVTENIARTLTTCCLCSFSDVCDTDSPNISVVKLVITTITHICLCAISKSAHIIIRFNLLFFVADCDKVWNLQR